MPILFFHHGYDQYLYQTDFFLEDLRKKSDLENTNKENEDAEEGISISTQELIEDARERRTLKLRNTEENLKCEQCNYTTGSKTLLQRHINSIHEGPQKEMRIRFSCDTCDYKTTSETMLILHK